ncbi:hypothetical protein FQR65_LT01644 [Abscondita terminalis]|nr:hypothetical protein FQR65_LT01644 [Abscondita terminalis]
MGLHCKKKLTCSARRRSKTKFLKEISQNRSKKKQIHAFEDENIEITDYSDLPDLNIEYEDSNIREKAIIDGRRIVDLIPFLEALKSLKHSGFDCSFYDMNLASEISKGFKSELTFVCNVCGKKECISTEGKKSKDINTSAVGGALSIGIGQAQLSEFCSSLNIPSITSKTYIKHQDRLHTYIDQVSSEHMLSAGKKEYQLAMELGDVDNDGIPYITVIVDGAWAKRSYKTNYNSLSGVACIIGARTKKVLYVGIKNKYCALCEKYKTNLNATPNHKCYKNWSGTSTSMEAAIILDGFKCSIDMHNIRYKYLIGDGDSSVYRKIREGKPYGPSYFVQKIECRNHILRNFCNRVKDLTNRPKVLPAIKTFLKSNIMWFRTAIVCATKQRKKEIVPLYQKIENLKEDIINGPRHIFGDHSKCKEDDSVYKYFCSGPKQNELNIYEKFRCSVIFDEFQSALLRVANNSSSLLYDVDNNSVENYNSIVNKLVGGKRINFCKRGSYESRCKAAAISVNNRGAFIDLVQERFDDNIVGRYTKKHAEKVRSKINKTLKKKTVCNEDEDYGLLSEVVDDKNLYELTISKNKFLIDLYKVSHQQVLTSTVGQNSNPNWQRERLNRITASNFGAVCKMRKTTNTKSLVNTILSSSSNYRHAKSLEHGIINESVAKKLLVKI